MGADRITQGQSPSDPYDSPGAIVVDAVSGLLQTVTNNRALVAAQQAIAAVGAQTAVTAITAAKNLFSTTLPTGLLNEVGRTVAVDGWGIYSSAGGTTPTISIALVLAGVTLCIITSSPINTAANTNLPFQVSFQFTVITAGSAGTIECHGNLIINLSANSQAAAPTQFADTNTGVSGAVNLTTADTLTVTIAASSAVSSAQLRLGSVSILA